MLEIWHEWNECYHGQETVKKEQYENYIRLIKTKQTELDALIYVLDRRRKILKINIFFRKKINHQAFLFWCGLDDHHQKTEQECDDIFINIKQYNEIKSEISQEMKNLFKSLY